MNTKITILVLLLLLTSFALADSYQEYTNTPAAPEGLPSNFHTDLNSGAATYSYPIQVSPGTNGLAPALALTYNSHARNSYREMVGGGWSLTQSYIQRNVEHTPANQNDDTYTLILNGQSFDLV